MPTPLTAAIALAHERLHPRVNALLRQVERSAARHPEHPIPPATLAVARSLFAEARRILGRGAARLTGNATGSLAALGIALGQLVALLEAFEAENSGFSAKARCIVWRLDGPPQPVLRLKPPGVEAGPVVGSDPQSEKARTDLVRLVMARFAAGYDEGYRDASERKPPSSRYAEDVWDSLVKESGGDEPARLRELKRRYGTTKPPPHLMPVGAKPGEWQRIEAERRAEEQAERLAKYGAFRAAG